MKKNYETPVAEKIEFAYRDQVVAASINYTDCIDKYSNVPEGCHETYLRTEGPVP